MPDQLTQTRDEIAEMCGFHKHPNLGWCRDTTPISDDCPIPACLNFVSRVWPDGWKWSYGSTPEHGWRWTAQNKYSHVTIEMDMSDRELVDRLSLLVLVLEWLQAHDRPAFEAACEKIRKEIGK